jgi:hypothetical protein
MNANAISLESRVEGHQARIESLHERQKDQQDAMVRMETKLDHMNGVVLAGLVAAIGALLAGVFNLLKH